MNKKLKGIVCLPVADCKTFKLLSENRDKVYDTETIKSILNINLTTVQRAVKRLYDKDLIKRSQINLDGGGYKLLYQALSKEDEIKQLISYVDVFYNKLRHELENEM